MYLLLYLFWLILNGRWTFEVALLGLAVGCWVGAPVSATIVVVLIATYAVARCLKWAGNKMHRRDVNKMISS